MPPSFASTHPDRNTNGMHAHVHLPHAAPRPTQSRTIRLCVSAPTQYGQQILVAHTSSTSPSPSLASLSPSHMSYEHPALWTISLPSHHTVLRYKYLLSQDGETTEPKWETGPDRLLNLSNLSPSVSNLLVRDVWRHQLDFSTDIFSTAAFTRVLFRNVTANTKAFDTRLNACISDPSSDGTSSAVVVFKAFVERLVPGDVVCLLGDCPQLGNNDISKAIPLIDASAPIYSTAVTLPLNRPQCNFSFLIRRGDAVVVKDTTERQFTLNGADSSFLSSKHGNVPVIYAPCERSFSFQNRWKGAGIALSVFSIRSRRSCGIGEFLDLIKVIDLCKATGYQLLQLLPINDTNVYNDSRDSYPYSAVSSFALHPQYLNIDELGTMPDELLVEYEQERDRLNRNDTIDVVDVMQVKMRFVREMFKRNRDVLQSSEFKAWFEENQAWLIPYALFRFFMHVNGTAEYDQWGVRSQYSAEEMAEFVQPSSFHYDHLALVYYIQFHLHKQLRKAAEHAEANSVVFKGDLPIGVNRYCADTWTDPNLFRFHMQAGAPPDFFSKYGQNWLFPTYNWAEMKKDNFGWWRARLSHMARYFHAYRIDHILGLFRIWEIPESFRTGMSGRFYPAQAISRSELESKGLWDMDRYTKPYVHDGILQQSFGEEWWKIKEKFFDSLWENRLQFKKKFDTEKKVEKAFIVSGDVPEHERAKNNEVMHKLFDLFNNVCLLIDDEDENMFHPRFMMQTTSSFCELPCDDWRRVLHELQEDYVHRRQDELWRRNGLERLPMMKVASDMLVCGEDLGLIPECVPSVMEETQILSLAVQRMPAGDVDFGIPSEYKYECVATTSSHDTSTFRGWWEEISDEMRRRYWTDVMQRSEYKGAPPSECTPEIVEWAISDHLKCPAMWTIFPLQDLLGMDASLRRKNAEEEQINDPSNPNHVWCFRLHVDTEKILECKGFVEKLRHLNKTYGRGTVY